MVGAGVWECTPGTFRRDVSKVEVMHFLAGKCTFTPNGEKTISIHAGDTLFMPPNTQGTWVVEETVRKVFVTI